MRPFRWTKFRKLIRQLMTDPLWSVSRSEVKSYLKQLRQKAAKEQNWCEAELVCAIVADQEHVDQVARHLGLC